MCCSQLFTGTSMFFYVHWVNCTMQTLFRIFCKRFERARNYTGVNRCCWSCPRTKQSVKVRAHNSYKKLGPCTLYTHFQGNYTKFKWVLPAVYRVPKFEYIDCNWRWLFINTYNSSHFIRLELWPRWGRMQSLDLQQNVCSWSISHRCAEKLTFAGWDNDF